MVAIGELKALRVKALLNSIEDRTIEFGSDEYIRNKLNIIRQEALLEQDSVNAISKHLKNNKITLDPDIAAISILNKAGVVVASTIKSVIGSDFSDHEEYIQITDIGMTVFTHRPHFTEYLGINSLELSAPIISMKNGEVAGIIINAYNEGLIDKTTNNRKGMGNSDRSERWRQY
ncbi:MAG: hypothetical protein HON76_07325 [Candidatus Scalindua sp.]|jgi:hypothetical protein|nr:hypothetical protein [Candidatus Scalindua sp.]MBT6052978.1 hypothetical protein [Candidatus Scalindua sp.]MBT6225685.1 hypothetical protein [Candidatus Scalindua sp.]MBT6562321.1 hypothetical protein [Candidatus Scalindua sp.]MBT7212254.1 hypothetical protein [Candidatus Scalindua sp.]